MMAQKSVDDLEGLINRTSKRQCTARCCVAQRLGICGIVKKFSRQRDYVGAGGDLTDALRLEHSLICRSRIGRVRTGEYRTMQSRWFEWVVSAERHKRTADESEPREPIEQAEFTHRIGDVDRRVSIDVLVLGTLMRFACCAKFGDFTAARGMARHNDRQ